MTSKKFLSTKKTSQQTISISPALKDWVQRYVNVERKKNPKEKKFRSVSAFYNYVMETILRIFESGKSLEDLERFVDSKVQDLFDEISFKALIPLYEDNIEKNKYFPMDIDSMLHILLKYKDFLIDKNNPSDKSIEKTVKRIKNFMISNNVTKEFRFDIIDNNYILNYSGTQPNIHFDHTKGLAGLAGILGLKLIDFVYSKNYVRAVFEKTSLLERKDFAIKERKALFEENTNQFINYHYVVNDKPHHLWIKMSDINNAIISFKDIKSGKKVVEYIIEGLYKHQKGKLVIDILKLFENFRWIEVIEDVTENLSFRFKISERDHGILREIIIDTLNKLANLEDKDGCFYLK